MIAAHVIAAIDHCREGVSIAVVCRDWQISVAGIDANRVGGERHGDGDRCLAESGFIGTE